MVDYTVTAANVVAGANAITRTGIAGATVTAGQTLYEDPLDGMKLKPGDANASTTTARIAGIALHGAANNQPITYVTDDDDFTPGATLTTGAIVVASATAGGIAPAADVTTGWIPVVLGVAKSSSKMMLRIVRGTAAV